ncbi:MAG: bifunctional pyr operon transcriptional regulator/uracil phosphoribosyltransferase PyrR [Rhodocyclaceae bacterium]|nr:bifunctional pyr operon transcriptional regulator/uracil phosphoribosyltransferase PyrR [Rhodocyclaceae bacterium]MBP6108939.1 bifunctional pyr operon transcriptional regulator/uracil phosphoribosyltransferase PyrR [Rhodocyclaceae bacterium]
MKLPEAEQLLAQLTEQMRPQVSAQTALLGIHTGGVWLAERLHANLALSIPIGAIDVAFYRDDYHQRGLHGNARSSQIPFAVDGARVIIVDDVLYTGRTIRAAMNELFDHGRPSSVQLAVLVDRGGRELPIAADFCAHVTTLPAAQMLALERSEVGTLSFRMVEK